MQFWSGPDPEPEDEEDAKTSVETFGEELDDAMLGPASSRNEDEDDGD